MTSKEAKKILDECIPGLKRALAAAERNAAWAARHLEMDPSKLSRLINGSQALYLEDAIEINELVEELKKISLTA